MAAKMERLAAKGVFDPPTYTQTIDIRHRNELASIREEFFGKKGPASTLVGVTALAQPGWLIEVEAIAVI
jgi:enamine deaminase RidA (YjgF/YER057c/UK114 family)